MTEASFCSLKLDRLKILVTLYQVKVVAYVIKTLKYIFKTIKQQTKISKLYSVLPHTHNNTRYFQIIESLRMTKNSFDLFQISE